MHMLEGEVVNKVVVEIKIETGEGDCWLPMLLKCLQMLLYVWINDQRCLAYFPLLCFNVFVKLVLDILLRFFLGYFLFGNSNNALIDDA
jgi:hypothetical protein